MGRFHPSMDSGPHGVLVVCGSSVALHQVFGGGDDGGCKPQLEQGIAYFLPRHVQRVQTGAGRQVADHRGFHIDAQLHGV